MAKFIGGKGREFVVAIDVPSLQRCKMETGVDFLDPATIGAAWQAMTASPMQIVSVLYSICQDTLGAHGVTPEQFAAEFNATAVFDSAIIAIGDALSDFFPSPTNQLIRRAIETCRRVMDRKAEAAFRIMEGPEVEALLQAEIEESERQFRLQATSGKSSIAAQGSSESTHSQGE